MRDARCVKDERVSLVTSTSTTNGVRAGSYSFLNPWASAGDRTRPIYDRMPTGMWRSVFFSVEGYPLSRGGGAVNLPVRKRQMTHKSFRTWRHGGGTPLALWDRIPLDFTQRQNVTKIGRK